MSPSIPSGSALQYFLHSFNPSLLGSKCENTLGPLVYRELDRCYNLEDIVQRYHRLDDSETAHSILL